MRELWIALSVLFILAGVVALVIRDIKNTPDPTWAEETQPEDLL